MSDIAIRVENLGKSYRIGRNLGSNGHSSPGKFARRPFEYLASTLRKPTEDEIIWALSDVSFEVMKGEVVGIIGQNGAGKSTLLKILSRITEPTRGRALVKGRVGSLLEVGTGFHPELTGRENIYLSGAILGMRKAEIDRRFDEIIEFAGTESFINTPIKRYSSGMYVRLAFAVAAHLEPEILLVDEVLAVGDVAFQRKCVRKMIDVSRSGKTVVLVSHNMALIKALCQRSLLLRDGEVVEDGQSTDVMETYLTESVSRSTNHFAALSNHPNRLPGMASVLTDITIRDTSLRPRQDFTQSETVVIDLGFDAQKLDQAPDGAGFVLETLDGSRVAGFNTYMVPPAPFRLPVLGSIEFRVDGPELAPGGYLVSASLNSQQNHLLDKVEKAASFFVHPDDIYGTGYFFTSQIGVVALRCTVLTKGLKSPTAREESPSA